MKKLINPVRALILILKGSLQILLTPSGISTQIKDIYGI